jgi:hypothetical protein
LTGWPPFAGNPLMKILSVALFSSLQTGQETPLKSLYLTVTGFGYAQNDFLKDGSLGGRFWMPLL